MRVTSLQTGSHKPGTGMCVMEAAAYIRGETWSDHPLCVAPPLAAFLRALNDGCKDDAERSLLLCPYIEAFTEGREVSLIQFQEELISHFLMFEGFIGLVPLSYEAATEAMKVITPHLPKPKRPYLIGSVASGFFNAAQLRQPSDYNVTMYVLFINVVRDGDILLDKIEDWLRDNYG